MSTVFLIRHGMTKGNMEKRYIGRTDEALCAFGVEQASALSPILPRFDAVFSSPLLRCRQTASILFPEQPIRIIEGLRECDFGIFEGKNAAELSESSAYIDWLNSYCTAPIPGGDDVSAFKTRSSSAFAETAFSLPEDCAAAFVLHGGVIMAILERFTGCGFYDYHIDNCQYVRCDCCNNGALTVVGDLQPFF